MPSYSPAGLVQLIPRQLPMPSSVTMARGKGRIDEERWRGEGKKRLTCGNHVGPTLSLLSRRTKSESKPLRDLICTGFCKLGDMLYPVLRFKDDYVTR
jgi:hypothetical protein